MLCHSRDIIVEHPFIPGKPRPLKALRYSKALTSAIIVAALNLVFLFTNPLKGIDPDCLPSSHSWIWWARTNFLSQLVPPRVVILGSSLMMNPVWENEADFLNKDVDIVAHRSVQYLDAAIESRLGSCEPATFNFALPGAMLSDDYMVLRTILLKRELKPDVIVLGLSPRDFVDNGFACAASSEHYRYLSRFTDTKDLVELAMPHPWQRFTHYLHTFFYFEGKKADFQVALSTLLRNETSRLLGSPTLNKAPMETRKAIYQTELEKGLWLAHPRGADHYDLAEDKKLRKTLANKEGFDNQRKWFEMTLELCKKENIRVLVVNMPLTATNINLFGSGIYHNCMELMANTARKYDASFLDLQKAGGFDMADFTDMCHMDASGGRKALDLIAKALASERTLRQRLERNAGVELAKTSTPESVE